MTPEEREKLEAELKDLCQNEDVTGAATLAIRKYGPEIVGYLMAVSRNEDTAGEVFAIFSEDLWKGLPKFRWESSFRTWAYTLARHALHRFHRDPQRKRKRLAFSQSPEVQELVNQVRTTTLVYLRTDVKDSVAALREQLDPEDQSLLILRIDRKMSWRDIAAVMHDGDEPDAAELKRSAASLRKRFERLKNTLRDMAREHGIIS